MTGYNHKLLQAYETNYLKHNIPDIDVGDVLQINLLTQENNKDRIQISEGVVISIKHASIRTTFTIRKSLQGIGVERVYCIHSPKITHIKVIKKAKVRRAKLLYLREKYGKATRLKQKFI